VLEFRQVHLNSYSEQILREFCTRGHPLMRDAALRWLLAGGLSRRFVSPFALRRMLLA